VPNWLPFLKRLCLSPDFILAATAVTALTLSQPKNEENDALLKGVLFATGTALIVNRFVRKVAYGNKFLDVIADQDLSSIVIDTKPQNSPLPSHIKNKNLYSGFTATLNSFQATSLGYIFFKATSSLPSEQIILFAIPTLSPYAADIADHFHRAYKVYTNQWHLIDVNDMEVEFSPQSLPQPT